MAEWRISDEQPVRELDGLDYERCAALHNYIVELGWTQRGLALDTLDKRTWWECYGGDAALTIVSNRLEAAVISFLKVAWHGFSMETASPPHLFHRYLARLCFPDELWQNVNYAEDEDNSNKRCFVSLYMANGALGATHPLGLILDQDYGMAMQHMSIRDTSITMNGRQTWLPLETILDGFIDMIDQGKVLTVGEAYNGEQERTEPWIMPSYTQRDLDDTLEAFQQLVNTIHDKMPSQPQDTKAGLLDLVTGGHPQMLPSNSFAYQFLAKSPIPSFTYIAPGLRIAQHQSFAPASEQAESNKLYPLLIFSSTHSAYQETLCAPWGDLIPISPFSSNFSTISTCAAGLYLTETEPHHAHPFEDGCKLVLPFLLGANGFARTSDDALIGENVHSAGDNAAAKLEPRSTELYQLGFNHFIAAHDVQLKYVLWNWVAMVEEGKWEVDADGVVGGIEKWREADTEEHWSDYQLPMSW
ncbi:hypothetical protein BU25DRAFT_392248 [Macroventuria anomochaeta]|uniref:Uncharacterized protein n=1 Tax=Macroventuria anomochaeta TaxID=301207 RepID=A0ACB6S1E9_9PLEO|nr:uncharacterized protein BU25DRAFT_392248 [Macroventuria anomochaeta]KAF2627858.1 hypothetical protein BU25DRAFT_392248 [Macroventuria anomochaeta]